MLTLLNKFELFLLLKAASILESTDLEKVTVKSLEEIKREKELRKESAVLPRLSIPSLPDPASQIANGNAADSAENDVNGSSKYLIGLKP